MTKSRRETDNARDTQYSIGHVPKRILVHATVASKPVRARLLWATLSLVLPVTFGQIAACRSAALALSAAIHFVMKTSAPCFAVLCHSPSSWAAIVHLSGWMPKTLRSSRRHPIHYFSCSPAEPTPPTSSPNITHFGSLVSSMRATNPANRIRLLLTHTRHIYVMLCRGRLNYFPQITKLQASQRYHMTRSYNQNKYVVVVAIVVVLITLTDRAQPYSLTEKQKTKKRCTRLPIRFVVCWTGKQIEKN